MLTASAIIDMVLKMLKEPTDGTGHWTRAEVLSRANMCQDRITREIPDLLRDEDTSLTTVANQANYTIPSNVGMMISVRVDGKPLNITSEETLDRDSQRGIISEDWKSDETGEPTKCYFRKGIMYLSSVPTSAYAGLTITILHELILTEMTDSTSSYPLETQYNFRQAQDLLIFATVAWLSEEDGNTGLADRMESKFGKGIQDLIIKFKVLGTQRDESLCKEKGNEDDESEISPGNYTYK